MILRVCLLIPLYLITCCGYASGEFIATGPSAGMAFASVTARDVWSACNNPAGLAYMKKWNAGLSLQNNYLLKELYMKAAMLSIPVWKGSIGLCFQHQGFDLYGELKAGLTYSMRLTKKFSLGARLNYTRISQGEGYGCFNILSFDAGAQFAASDHLEVGVLIINPIAVKITMNSSERLATQMSIGIDWEIANGLKTALQVDKDLINKPVIRAGVEYQIARPLFIRTGLIINTLIVTAGTGFEAGAFRVDLSCSYHPTLGYSPGISVSYGSR
jgi:hypothetical protein